MKKTQTQTKTKTTETNLSLIERIVQATTDYREINRSEEEAASMPVRFTVVADRSNVPQELIMNVLTDLLVAYDGQQDVQFVTDAVNDSPLGTFIGILYHGLQVEVPIHWRPGRTQKDIWEAVNERNHRLLYDEDPDCLLAFPPSPESFGTIQALLGMAVKHENKLPFFVINAGPNGPWCRITNTIKTDHSKTPILGNTLPSPKKGQL